MPYDTERRRINLIRRKSDKRSKAYSTAKSCFTAVLMVLLFVTTPAFDLNPELLNRIGYFLSLGDRHE